jgi:hypothetical protein
LYGPYLYGNPYEERKVCLHCDLLDQKQLTGKKQLTRNRMGARLPLSRSGL